MHLSTTDENYHLVIPPLYKLQQRAQFLSRKLPVSTSQSQDIIAVYYGCASWGELKQCALSPMSSNIERRYPEMMGLKHTYYDPIFRKQLSDLCAFGWNDDVGIANILPLRAHTVLHALSNSRIDWLLNEEVALLHYNIYHKYYDEFCDIKDIANLNEPDNFVRSNRDLDNCLLPYIHKMIKQGRNQSRSFIYDYRFCLQFYYNIFFEDGQVRIVIRELDSYLQPSRKYHPLSLLTRKWWKNYIHGYIQYLTNYLKEAGISGNLEIWKINQLYCADPRRDVRLLKIMSPSTKVDSIPNNAVKQLMSLRNDLMEDGAQELYIDKKDDIPAGLTISL